jgi:hypothetical protein
MEVVARLFCTALVVAHLLILVALVVALLGLLSASHP